MKENGYFSEALPTVSIQANAPMLKPYFLEPLGINVQDVVYNASPAVLYEEALKYDKGASISDNGALILKSGKKTGRSPKDKRIVEHENSKDDIWWGSVNMPMDEHTFLINKQRALDFFNMKERIYVVDGFAGWDPKYRLKIRIVCTRPYHALFMHNMMIRPTAEELANFGEPDYVIYNAGEFVANRMTSYMSSTTSIDLCFERKEFVILGTEYAGEMKKGIFTIMNYLMPKAGIMSMHCSANVGEAEDTTLFFGLSGTGKTTLSADPHRHLIGDDEHCWTDEGVFNMEGGCYAKAVHLSEETEPEIFHAIKFGTVLENVIYDEQTHHVDYDSTAITENTRAAYPIEFIPNAKIPCVSGHPKNIIFLTCDAFGVLPPVAKLSSSQAMYHFISGYTAKIAGTEDGITEPQATFSACFGAAFMVWHPAKYAELLAEKLDEHQAQAWLVNTGWSGGGYGEGKRMKLAYTRAIIDAIHDGSLADAPVVVDARFGFEVPQSCANVPDEMMNPKSTWTDGAKFEATANKLAGLFNDNFKKFEEGCSEAILSAKPKTV